MVRALRLAMWGTGLWLWLCLSALAQTPCQEVRHRVAPSETLLDVAERYYGDPAQWLLLVERNRSVLRGRALVDLPEGSLLVVPCASEIPLPATVPAPEPATALQKDEAADIRLVSVAGFAPFTDRDWPREGLATELVAASLGAGPYVVPFSVTWGEGGTRQVAELVESGRFDMGFPFYRPDCAATPTEGMCDRFHFSDPLAEILIVLFTRSAMGDTIRSDADVIGKTLCRPGGVFTHDLDRAGRAWLRDGLVRLVQPKTAGLCFELLRQGQVDAVAINEFSGWDVVHAMGLEREVMAQSWPVSAQSLHAVISKQHPQGTANLYRFNAGLEVLRQSGRYDSIVAGHLERFWNRIK